MNIRNEDLGVLWIGGRPDWLCCCCLYDLRKEIKADSVAIVTLAS